MFRSFRFDPHPLSAQAIEFKAIIRMFRLWRSKCEVRQKNCAEIWEAREGWDISFYILKRNKRNSGTRQWEQPLSPFRTVPHCSTLAASAECASERRP